MIELWKDIKGYEGTYQISSFGNIKRIVSFQSNNKKIRNLNLFHTKSGYIRRALWKNGIKKNYQVHRLVADAFIPNDDINKIWVNHKNHIRDDNRMENLEWVTHQMNIEHAHKYSIDDVITFTISYIFDTLKIKQPDEINHPVIRERLYNR